MQGRAGKDQVQSGDRRKKGKEQAGDFTVASTRKAKQDRARRLRSGWFEQFRMA